MELARLKLLCRRASKLPNEAMWLVWAYLCFHVQWHVPLWMERLFENRKRSMPRCGSRSRSFRIVLATRARIDYADYRQDQISWYDKGPLQSPVAGRPVEVVVKIVIKFKPWKDHSPRARWELVCQQGNVCLRSAGPGRYETWSLDSLLSIRMCFTITAPYGSYEAPFTWRRWRRYVDLYLFGPVAPRLMLEPRPEAMEICSDCGNIVAPARARHAHGKVFCTWWCLEAHMVLMCSICHEPLIEGQGLCRPCLAAAQRGFWHPNA